MQSETAQRLNDINLDFYINSKNKKRDCKGLRYRAKPYTPQEIINLNGDDKYKSSCKSVEKFQNYQQSVSEENQMSDFINSEIPNYEFNTSLVVETESPKESYLYEYKVNGKDEYYRSGEKIPPFGQIIDGDQDNSQMFLDLKSGKEYYYNAFDDTLVGYQYPETTPEQLDERIDKIETVSKTHRDFMEATKGSVKLKNIDDVRRKLTLLSDNQVSDDLKAKEEYNKQLKELEKSFDNKLKALEETEKNKDVEKILIDRNKLLEEAKALENQKKILEEQHIDDIAELTSKVSELEEEKKKMLDNTTKIVGFYKNKNKLNNTVNKEIINNIDETVDKTFQTLTKNQILNNDFLKNENKNNPPISVDQEDTTVKNDEANIYNMSYYDRLVHLLESMIDKLENKKMLYYILIFALIFTITYYLVKFLNRSDGSPVAA